MRYVFVVCVCVHECVCVCVCVYVCVCVGGMNMWSPWYKYDNRTSWLGVKHQLTYMDMCMQLCARV